MEHWHKSDLLVRMYCTLKDGKKIAMPRYFKDKIYSERERFDIAQHAKNENIQLEKDFEDEMLKKYGEEWSHFKAQIDINQFKKMYQDAKKDRNRL